MKAQDTIAKITACAALYKKNLENRSIMFVFNAKNSPIAYLEANFRPRHFLHLTGVEVKSKLSSVEFYNKCIHGRLSSLDFSHRKDGTTELKLDVLPKLMEIHKTARMLGDYDGTHLKLRTDKIAGTVHACMGFVIEESTPHYVPNTVLKKDIRDITLSQAKIIAIYSKGIEEQAYSNLHYLDKNIALEMLKLPDVVSGKIDHGNLIVHF